MAVKYQEALGKEVFCWAEAAVTHLLENPESHVSCYISLFVHLSSSLFWLEVQAANQRSEFGHGHSPGTVAVYSLGSSQY